MEQTERDQILFGYDNSGKQLFRTLGVEKAEQVHYLKMLLFSFLAAWVPVAVLALVEGNLYDGTYLSFLFHPETQVRMLLALPLVVLCQPMIRSFCSVVTEYATRNLVREQDRDSQWLPLLATTSVVERSKWARIATIVLVIFMATRTALSATWIVDGSEHYWFAFATSDGAAFTLAGWWYHLVSLPILQYFMARALWKYLLWFYLMYRLSKLNIRLSPAHPDRMGGLSILSVGQTGFLVLTFALSCVVASTLTGDILAGDMLFNQARYEMVTALVILLIFLLVPMLLFMPKLSTLRRSALIEYATLGTRIGEQFHERWVDGKQTEENERIDPSFTTDYATVFEVAGQIKATPVTLRNVMNWAIVLAVPFIMVMLTQFSVEELFSRLMSVLR